MTDDSIDSIMHQGKSLAQWAEDFKGEFTIDQLEKMARGGADLQKILMLGLDEAEKLTPYEGLPGEETDMLENVNEISHEDEMAAFGESMSDVYVTVGDFKKALARNLAKDTDKIMFRDMDKKAYDVFDMSGKGGTFVIDLVKTTLNESIIPKFTVRVKARGITMNFTSTADTKDQAEEEIKNQLKKLLNDTNAKIDIEEVSQMKKEKIDESNAPNFSVYVKIGDIERAWTVNAKNEEDAQWQVLEKLMKKHKTLEDVTITKVRDLNDGTSNVNPFVDE